MSTLPLFDNPAVTPIARKSDPVSSKIAAEKITTCGARQKQLNAVLMLVKDHPHKTSKELGNLVCDINRYVTARRLPELEEMGLVRRVGVTDRTREVIWEACQ